MGTILPFFSNLRIPDNPEKKGIFPGKIRNFVFRIFHKNSGFFIIPEIPQMPRKKNDFRHHKWMFQGRPAAGAKICRICISKSSVLRRKSSNHHFRPQNPKNFWRLRRQNHPNNPEKAGGKSRKKSGILEFFPDFPSISEFRNPEENSGFEKVCVGAGILLGRPRAVSAESSVVAQRRV